MAVEKSNGTTVPHATNYSDLLTKLITFATAHGWTQMENTADKTVLKGEGAGSDQIYVAIQKYSDVPTDTYGWYLNGYAGYTNGLTFVNQPGAIQTSHVGLLGHPAMPLSNSTIPYWFVVSGRRIIVIAKVSTTYQMCYLGFFLPFATPGQYPYPLAVGGCYAQASGQKPRWSLSSDSKMTVCCIPLDGAQTATNGTTLAIRMPDGSWRFPKNNTTTKKKNGVSPYNETAYNFMQPALGGDYLLTPLEIQTFITAPTASQDRLGEFDGLYHVSGTSQAAENIVTVGGVDHLVLPNVYRTGVSDYYAVKLA